ncbi:MAG: sulfotransferase [Candidatus Latescibacterota bacterium]|nr:MAG: sulfotransferase [Candidatus Latescibacterota bacterium]
MVGPVFIVGCERSGTTLLGLMLMQTKELHIVHETRFLTTLRERAEEYGDFTQPHQRWFFLRDLQREPATMTTSAFASFDLDLPDAEQALRAVAPATYPEAAAALYQAATTKTGKKRWGDKTPRYVTHIDWLSQAYQTGQFLHVIRDGRDAAVSITKARWQPNLRRAAEHWAHQVTIGRRMGAELPDDRYRELKFEELVERPEDQLQRVTGWLGVEYSASMLKFFEKTEQLLPKEHMDLFEEAKKPANVARAYAWKRSMSNADVADVEEIAGATLEACGYTLTGHEVSRRRKIERSLIGVLRPGLKTLRSGLRSRGSLTNLSDGEDD